jgi:hypothetical protein
MKTFRVRTKVNVVKTIDFIIEAESIEDVEKQFELVELEDGEEINEKYNWSGKTVTNIKFIEDLDT